jgi:hypothetical protein
MYFLDARAAARLPAGRRHLAADVRWHLDTKRLVGYPQKQWTEWQATGRITWPTDDGPVVWENVVIAIWISTAVESASPMLRAQVRAILDAASVHDATRLPRAVLRRAVLVDDDVDGRAGAEESVRPVRAAGHHHRAEAGADHRDRDGLRRVGAVCGALSATWSAPGIISIDLEPHAKLPQHPRITYRVGSSVDPEIVAVRARTRGALRRAGPRPPRQRPSRAARHRGARRVRRPGHAGLVPDRRGHQRQRPAGPADVRSWPGEAVDAFLAAHPEFVADPLPERYLVSMHPGGWLRRIA